MQHKNPRKKIETQNTLEPHTVHVEDRMPDSDTWLEKIKK